MESNLGALVLFALLLSVGLGLAGILHAEPRLHVALKYSGGAYLLYLAWCIARAEARAGSSVRANPIGLWKALLLQWVNPKAWVFAVAAMTAFTPVGGNILSQTLVIAFVSCSTCLLSVVVWSGFGAAIGRYLASPRARRAFNASMAGLLIASLVPVFL